MVTNSALSDKIQKLLEIPKKRRRGGKGNNNKGSGTAMNSVTGLGGVKEYRRKKGQLLKALTDRLDEERWLLKSRHSEYKKSKKE